MQEPSVTNVQAEARHCLNKKPRSQKRSRPSESSLLNQRVAASILLVVFVLLVKDAEAVLDQFDRAVLNHSDATGVVLDRNIPRLFPVGFRNR